MIFLPLVQPVVLAVLLALAVGAFVVVFVRTHKKSELNGLAWIRRALILALVGFMGFGPGVMEATSEEVRVNLDVYLVVDRTGSMAAQDYNGNDPRLEGVKHDITQLAGELNGARFSVLSFDSVASRQLPLTTDSAALLSWAESLTQEITIYSSGSNMNRVLGELSELLKRGKDRNPQNQQYVYFLTDGENTSEESRMSFGSLKGFINGGAVLGYGTAKGGQMKRYDPLLNDENYIMDSTGGSSKRAVSKIDEAQLKSLAQETGLPYLHRAEPGSLSEVTSSAEGQLVTGSATRALEVPQLLLWPFAAALSVLLLWELIWVSTRMTKAVG